MTNRQSTGAGWCGPCTEERLLCNRKVTGRKYAKWDEALNHFFMLLCVFHILYEQHIVFIVLHSNSTYDKHCMPIKTEDHFYAVH